MFFTVFLAAYQIAIGIDRMDKVAITAYTIAFGVLLVACLLIIILGLDVLELPIVVIFSTIIPLTLSLGLVWQRLEAWRNLYLSFSIVSFIAVIITRSFTLQNKLPVIVIAVTHGISGMMIFLLPFFAVLQADSAPLFLLVGLGGASIGILGLLLSFLKAGKPLLPREKTIKLFPVLLFITTALFIAGFKYG